MNMRLVSCLALVALMALGSVNANGEIDLSASAEVQKSASVEVQKTAVLSVPKVSVGLDIKKESVPLVTVSEAPCKTVCAPKCTISMERQCLNITVPKKNCAITTRSLTKQFCEKKCNPTVKLNIPEINIPTKFAIDASKPNPSAPPAAVADTAATHSLDLSMSKSVAGNGASVDVKASVSAGKGARKLQGLPLLAKLAKTPAPELALNCQDVCVDVPIQVPDVACTETSEQVEKCTQVPNKTCTEECTCVPMKKLSLNMPQKPSVSLSLNKGN